MRLRTFAGILTLGAVLSPAAAAPPADPRGMYLNSPFMRDAREYDFQSPIDWPAADTREVAFARARAVIAHWERMRTVERLNEHISRANRQFDSSPQYVAATQAEDQAWGEFQQAAASVTARLLADPQYLANLELASDLGQQIRDLAFEAPDQASSTAYVTPVVLNLANTKLSYSRRATMMRSEAMLADPAVAEARVKVQAAAAARKKLRDEFDNQVRDDAQVLALREAVHEARVTDLAAAAYEDTVRLTRRAALRFAIEVRENRGRGGFGGFYGSYYPSAFLFSDAGKNHADGPVAVNSGGYGFRRR